MEDGSSKRYIVYETIREIIAFGRRGTKKETSCCCCCCDWCSICWCSCCWCSSCCICFVMCFCKISSLFFLFRTSKLFKVLPLVFIPVLNPSSKLDPSLILDL